MIQLLRIDERLLHGMVAVSWTSSLQPEVIVIANTKAANDSFFSMTLKLAKPAGVDLRIFTLEDTISKLCNTSLKSKKVFLVTESLEDADVVINGIKTDNPVKNVNVSVAGIRKRDGLKQVIPQIFLNSTDFDYMRKFEDLGLNVFIQAVPSSQRATISDIKKHFEEVIK